jgi:hypothetical protein
MAKRFPTKKRKENFNINFLEKETFGAPYKDDLTNVESQNGPCRPNPCYNNTKKSEHVMKFILHRHETYNK